MKTAGDREMDWEGWLKTALADLRVSGDSLRECAEGIWRRENPGFADETFERAFADWLHRELNLELEDVLKYTPDADTLRALPADAARAYGVMPLALSEAGLKVGMVDPADLDLVMDLHLLTGLAIEPVTGERPALEKMIAQYYKGGRNGGGFVDFTAVRQSSIGEDGGDTQRGGNGIPGRRNRGSTGTGLAGPAGFPGRNAAAGKARAARILLGAGGPGDAPIVRLVNEIITEAIHSGSSDIHFEPYERDMKVRLRQDGLLRVHRTVNNRSKAEVVSRLKVMANLDIAEKRRPQDGRIRMQGGGHGIDIRVSTLPTEHGEKVVLRILDKAAVPLDLGHLGLDPVRLDMLKKALKSPYGMILATGPTGAGKTTTLYSALNLVKSPELNIITVEDPIEYKLEGVIQTAVKREVDFTFANALRTILRQDPNVIMVGEIRDRETAEIAVRAALTGHLVLSTLHTNDAPSAVTRLLDMGIEPFLLSSALTLIGAQRLVRRLCPHCLPPREGPPGEGAASLRPTRGCPLCHNTGYSGRVGLFELLPLSDGIRALINDRLDAGRIREKALSEGMVTLREDGLSKVGARVTSMEEVLRETA